MLKYWQTKQIEGHLWEYEKVCVKRTSMWRASQLLHICLVAKPVIPLYIPLYPVTLICIHIVYRNIPQSIACSWLIHFLCVLGFFHIGDPSDRHAAQPTNNRHRLQQPGRRDHNQQFRLVFPVIKGNVSRKKSLIYSLVFVFELSRK
jgi:hypothetical protein